METKSDQEMILEIIKDFYEELYGSTTFVEGIETSEETAAPILMDEVANAIKKRIEAKFPDQTNSKLILLRKQENRWRN